ncbi:hypothetical protein U9M48_030239 [Paspalum notatum var. saurae]|uniref:HhH-GPD domain-containing protein n=1 Tax=Paspalum notatum var. saurae TaxID=547442 RepID=A0AAQ3TZZ2_PASNO
MAVDGQGGPAPVAPIRLVHALPPPCAAMSAAEPPPPPMSEELEALPREKKRKRRRHGERAEATAPSSESPPPPPTPESKPEAPARVAPQTLAPAAEAEEAVVRKEEKKRKRRSRREAAPATPPSSATAAAQILEVESKLAAERETARKKRRRGAVEQEQEQEQSVQPPVPPVRVRSQGGEQAADGGNSGGVQSSKPSRGKRHRALGGLEIIRLRRELRKQQPGFVPPITDPYSFVQDQDPKYSSPFGAFFDQFCYKPDRPQNRDALQPPNSPDRAARPPPRGRPSSGSSLLNANGASKAAVTTASNAKRRRSASASTPGSQNNVKLEVKEKPKRKPAPLLTAAEKRSDKYRRLPLDQLVPPPRSPHRLLQEKYASDPWKVVVICMLLNLTQGQQVRNIVSGFFKRYPDAQAAYAAVPEEMANYLKPLGLQHVKTKNIQKFSKAYVEEEWTYITELCGVGKYAADAYAIFCAGRAKEVVPKDHKLVDYWKYVCFELPSIQTSQNAQDSAGVTGLGNVVVETSQNALVSAGVTGLGNVVVEV